MIIKVKRLAYEDNCTYAPPQKDAVINTDDVVSAVQTDARGSGPFLLVKFRDGSTMTIVGTPDTLLVQKPDAASTERDACIAIIRQYLLYDSQRAVSWHEVQDVIAAIQARGQT